MYVWNCRLEKWHTIEVCFIALGCFSRKEHINHLYLQGLQGLSEKHYQLFALASRELV